MKRIILPIACLTFATLSMAQNVGINSTGANPAGDAMLDIVATDKGLLIPRVALTSTADVATITGATTSLLVYNSATAGDVTPGFYYWDGSVWVRFSETGDDWRITGNAGTTSGTNFLGTTDGQALDFRTNNTIRFRVANGDQVYANANGSAAAPFYSWNSDQNMGIYRNTTDVMGLVTNGTERFRIPNADQVHAMSLGTTALPFYSFSADPNTGMWSAGADLLGFSTTALERFRIDDSYQVQAMGDGTAAAPFYSWQADQNMGIYRNTTDVMGFVTAGTERLRIPNANQVHAMNLGTAALPFYTWSADPNTGIWSPSADAMAVSTAGSERMRFLNNGEVVVGATTTTIADDLFSGVSNVTLDWAVNGYSAFNGSGVYGSITSGSTSFGAIQGEYYGTSRLGTGVIGLTTTSTAGTDFDGNTVSATGGVLLTGNLTRSFGVMGQTGDNVNTRTGGVMGTDYFARGALGYYANNGNDYGLYGFGVAAQTGAAGGIITNPNGPTLMQNKSMSSGIIEMEENAQIGIGAYGGVMGGWIKGIAYGANFSGGLYGTYTDGKAITNDVFVCLDNFGTGERQASYAMTSTKVEVVEKGKETLSSGTVYVSFPDDFKSLLSTQEDIIVTVSPLGESNGIFVTNVTNNGFEVKENAGGMSNVQFNWIAVGTKTGYENVAIDANVLSDTYDANMYNIMWNDDADAANPVGIWWDGSQVQFGTVPAKTLSHEILDMVYAKKRPTETKPKSVQGQSIQK